MPNKIATKSTGLTVEQLKQSEITLRIVGTGPLIYNSMSLKAMSTLFIGLAKKNMLKRKTSNIIPKKNLWIVVTSTVKMVLILVSHLQVSREVWQLLLLKLRV